MEIRIVKKLPNGFAMIKIGSGPAAKLIKRKLIMARLRGKLVRRIMNKKRMYQV